MQPNIKAVKQYHSNRLIMQATQKRRITRNGAMNEVAKAEVDSLESPPIISPLTHSSLSDSMNCLLLSGGVGSYVELYCNERENQNHHMGLNNEQPSFQQVSNSRWCSRGKSFPQSKMPNGKMSMVPLCDIQDDWKNCDPNVFNFNSTIVNEISDTCKENVDPSNRLISDSFLELCKHGREWISV